VSVGVALAVAVTIGVALGVDVDVLDGVGVAVGVDVLVGVGVGVDVGDGEAVRVSVPVGVGEGVPVTVDVGVGDGVLVAVNVGVAVSVGVAVGVGVKAAATPPLPVLSVLFVKFESASIASTEKAVSNEPAASTVATIVTDVLANEANDAIVHGRAAHPLPDTLVIVRLDGIAVSWTLVAVFGPALLMSTL
jgi:hypothetical protein